MEKVFHWAFIGAGGIARSVSKRIFGSGRHKLAAVYNRTREKAEKLAAEYGGTVYDSPEAAVSDVNADGVYVNVTNNVHFEYCRRALNCGKPVLLEKPFTTDAAQAAELFDIAESNGVYLGEAMWTWFSDQANALRSRIADGAIGKIKSGLITLCLPIAFGKKSRLLRSELAGGALLDLGIYPITYAYRLFGDPKSIDCSARFKFGVDVSDDIVLKYDGFDIKIKISVRGFRGVGERLEIVGEKGKIISGGYHSGSGFTVKTSAGCEKFPSDKNAMLTQFDRVAEEIIAGKKHSEFVPPQATVDVMKIMDAVRGEIGLRFDFEKTAE